MNKHGVVMGKYLCFIIAILISLYVVSQSARHVSNIRDVDFRNFSYPFEVPDGRTPFAELGDAVSVRDGIAYAGKVGDVVDFLYFSVAEINYADLTGDSQEEAAVVVIYGSNSGTFYLTNIYLYTVQDGKPLLLGTLTEDQVSRDYRQHYGGDRQTVFEAIESGRAIKAEVLTVMHLADGAHCCPESVVTLRYRLDGNRLKMIELLKSRPMKGDQKMKAFYKDR